MSRSEERRCDFAASTADSTTTATTSFAACAPGEAAQPLPWSNVIANPQFGFLVTESGGGYTWGGNSRENKLTSWSNDPITDPPSEDHLSPRRRNRRILDADAAPLRDDAEYRIEHGRGFSRFRAHSRRHRKRIAAFDCTEFLRQVRLLEAQEHERAAADAVGHLLRRVGAGRESADDANARPHRARRSDWCTDWPTTAITRTFLQQVAFLHVLGGADSVTGDRGEFVGRNGSRAKPAAMRAS